MSLACVSGCTQHRQHLTGCPCADPQHQHGFNPVDWEAENRLFDGDIPVHEAPGCEECPRCDGCLPRLAASHLDVCDSCERATTTALNELPDLWVDLAERPRLAGVSKAPTTEGDPASPANDDQIAERSVIKSILVTWCKVLEEDHSITVPHETVVAATSRTLAAWHSDQARHAREAANLLDMPTTGPLHRDADGAVAMRKQAAQAADNARAVRDDRETGRDILRALCEHLHRHNTTLLTSPHAKKYVSDLRDARHDARGKAYPTSPERLTVPCPQCGGRNKARLDTDGDITCRQCGARGDARWWGANAEHEPMTLTDLRAYLATEGLYPTPRQLRSWADKGKLETTRPGRGPDGKMQDRTFDPLKSLHVVAELLAHKRHERRVA